MAEGTFNSDTSFTTNRELSWLKFNERVLQVANDPAVPLLERLKFVAIFVSNLDEFFMIRVGSLVDLSIINEGHIDNKSGMTIKQQLRSIYKVIPPLYKQKDAAFQSLSAQLRHFGIVRPDFKELDSEELKYVDSYFEHVVSPVLSPQVIDTHHPFPHIENKSLNIAVLLKSKDGSKFGIIPVPKMLRRILYLKNGLAKHILIEDLILNYTEKVFEMYEVEEKAVISVTRNADLNPDDETYDFEEDFRYHMKKILKKRARLAAVRLEVSAGCSKTLIGYLSNRLQITRAQVYTSAAPLELSYIYDLENHMPVPTKRAITYTPYLPQYPPDYNPGESMTKQILSGDMLLSYPYESMDPFLQLVKESAADPAVISIKITLYRLDKKSRLAQYLIDAAENDKDVTVIMELRARFDEQNNIEWAERLEESGCKVIYGFKDYKVHSKICLITRHEKNRMYHITQIGTGNYNEKTSKLYTDFCLMTANKTIAADASSFFKNMLVSNLDSRYSQLLVAPTWLKTSIFALIDAEIDKANNGEPSGIILKMNSLTDRDTLDKLSEASNAGVNVKLIIRGICCLVPGIPGKTENVTVTSVIGRFLEHARVYCFGSGPDTRLYISSADLMTRNTERRIEIAAPVLDEELKERVLSYLNVQLSPETKSWALGADGDYLLNANEYLQVTCQDIFMKEAMNLVRPKKKPKRASRLIAQLKTSISKLLSKLPAATSDEAVSDDDDDALNTEPETVQTDDVADTPSTDDK